MNLLARFSSAPTHRHWNGVKHIFKFLKSSFDLCLFFPYSETREQKILSGIGGSQPSASHQETVSDAAIVAIHAHGRLVPYPETPNNVLVEFADVLATILSVWSGGN